MSLDLDAYLRQRSDRCSGCGRHPTAQGCICAGLRAKERGQAIAAAAHPDERARVDAAIRQLAATGRPFSSNTARPLHGVTGPVVGAAFTAARKAGLIQPVGYEPSNEPGTHAHPVRTWLGARSIHRPATKRKVSATPRRSSTSAWDDREEGSSWIDKL